MTRSTYHLDVVWCYLTRHPYHIASIEVRTRAILLRRGMGVNTSARKLAAYTVFCFGRTACLTLTLECAGANVEDVEAGARRF